MKKVNKNITLAFDNKDTSRIEDILNQVNDTETLAIARLRRLLIAGTPLPVLADIPAWLKTQVKDINPNLVTETFLELIIRAVLAVCPDITAEVYEAPLHRVEVVWSTGDIWLVYISRLCWPGAEVRVYWAEDSAKPLSARNYYTIDSLLKFMQGRVYEGYYRFNVPAKKDKIPFKSKPFMTEGEAKENFYSLFKKRRGCWIESFHSGNWYFHSWI